jgi:N-acetyl-anhydromuramyl-L-alanine amidase AmpD
MPLDERAYHAGRRNAQSVSVLLLLNGDAELPPEAAQQALGKIVRALQERLSLFSEDAVQLHRDVDPTKTCPGRLITREFVDEQLREAM